jgi:outer membrane protein OmpA-like peptidoglycan-associated protein
MRSLSIAGTLLLGTVATACAARPPLQSEKIQSLPEPGVSQEYRVEFPDLGRGRARYIVLTLGDDMAEDCGHVNAHFAFDAVEPLPQDHVRIRDMVDCFNQPSNKNHDVLLVGRADARGASEYNQALGQRRAERVKQILVDAGVDAARIHTASSGESAAVGDERRYSHGYDRRVDVGLLGMTHAPRRR